MELQELKKCLADRAEAVCAHLLPGGKKDGNEWVCGDLSGTAGKSLKIVLTGAKAGVWKDFAGDAGGSNLLELWVQARGLAFQDALAEARQWLGDAGVRTASERKLAPKTYSKPDRTGVVWIANKAEFYLTSERQIPRETIKDYLISMTDDGKAIVFPYLSELDGKAQMLKWLKLERDADGKKITWTSKNTPKVLFGKHTVRPSDRYLLICEGETDAMSWHAAGIPGLCCTSVPFGAKWESKDGNDPNSEWIDNDWEFISRFERIYLSMDMDDEGQKARNSIIKRLGRELCFVVALPTKDANEALTKVGKDALTNGLTNAKTLDPETLKNAGEFRKEVMDLLFRPADMKRGIPLPFGNYPFHLRWHEWTVVTGMNGGGKALAIDTKLPTPTGWTTMGEVSVGDTLFDMHGVPTRVVATTDVMLGRPCYRVTFDDGSEVIADEQHQWYTHTQGCFRAEDNSARRAAKRKSDRRFVPNRKHYPGVKTTKEIAESIIVRRPNGAVIHNHAVPVCKRLSVPEALVPIDPYVLGAWLGDGSKQNGSFTCAKCDAQIVDEIQMAGYEVTVQRPNSSDCSWGICGLQKDLRLLGVLNQKHVPAVYMRASESQRLSLLQGLMDTDGWAKNGRCEFCNTNLGLAKAVLELCISLGIRAKMAEGVATLYGVNCGPKYRVCFTTSVPVFRLKRKLEQIPSDTSSRTKFRWIVAVEPIESVPVRCVQVDSATSSYLCGEAMIPTHNSQLLGYVMLYLAKLGYPGAIASLEVRAAQTLAFYCQQTIGKKELDREEAEFAMDWMSECLWFYDHTGATTADKVLSDFRYAYRRHGVRFFVIDSWMCLGISGEDLDAQSAVVSKFTAFVDENEVHLFVVAHPRKQKDEEAAVGKMDVKGSGELTDKAHNVWTIWRNKKKEKAIERAVKFKEDELSIQTQRKAKPDTILYVEKQRNDEGDEPTIDLWFVKACKQFYGYFRESGRSLFADGKDESVPQEPTALPMVEDDDKPF